MMSSAKPRSEVANLLLKLRLFKNENSNFKVINAIIFKMAGRALFVVDPNQLKVATNMEIGVLLQLGYDLPQFMYRSLSSWNNSNQDINFETDIGFWEIAANRPGPHKDPAKFLAQVKARFESSEVQQWLKDQHTGKVLKALHEAGAD